MFNFNFSRKLSEVLSFSSMQQRSTADLILPSHALPVKQPYVGADAEQRLKSAGLIPHHYPLGHYPSNYSDPMTHGLYYHNLTREGILEMEPMFHERRFTEMKKYKQFFRLKTDNQFREAIRQMSVYSLNPEIWGIFYNPRTPGWVIRELVGNFDSRCFEAIQDLVAIDHRTPPDVIAKLVMSDNPRVREYVARRSDLSLEAEVRLLADTDYYVRQTSNHNLTFSNESKVMAALVSV